MSIEIFFTDDKQNSLQTWKPSQSEAEIRYLKRKTYRKNNFENSESRRCDLCLEHEKYSECKLIECILCESFCHIKCYNSIKNNLKFQLPLNKIKPTSEFECLRCNFSKINNLDQNLLW
jgi:hypothetical protein